MTLRKKTFRRNSGVHPLDKSGNVFKSFYIWSNIAPAVLADPSICYAKCLVLQDSTPVAFRCRQVEPLDPQERVFEVPAKNAFNVNSSIDPMNFPDIGMIPHTNDAAALDFIRQRFLKGQIYTEAKPLLVAVNPFKDLGNATDKVICMYRDTPDIDRLPPHVFTVARVALENLHAIRKSQTIVVSGESGAGKTEATKQVMRYFASEKTGSMDTRIQTAVLAANPVLEVANGGGIEYGCIKNFLLEKSRILTQAEEERSYHIFYQLIKSASSAQRKQFHLRQLTQYKFINSKCLNAPGINDESDWQEVQNSFDSINISEADKNSIFSMISGVLLLGNVVLSSVEKNGVPDAATIDLANKALFIEACHLLFLDPNYAEKGILEKTCKAGEDKVFSFWRLSEAQILKDSLSKGIYNQLFNWIVTQLNRSIEPPNGFNHFMAMLDIFGFEVFDHNSLEQLFINITNEMLQKNFIDAVFDRETKLYRDEGISAADLIWTTNDELIRLLTAKHSSVTACLEDQCLAPGGTDEKFLTSAHGMLKNSPKFVKMKVGSDVNFAIEHTIGQIAYDATGFLFKNKDILRPELVEVIKSSINPVARDLFVGVTPVKGKLAKGQLIGSQFLRQLSDLMALVNDTESHFIRCIKPNECKTPLKFVQNRVLTQLNSLSILEALQLRNLGYSYRRPFHEFLQQYRFVDLEITNNKSLLPRDAATLLLKYGTVDGGWQIGKTMVFMKPAAMKAMAKKQRERLAVYLPLVEMIEALALKRKYRFQYNNQHRNLVGCQSRCRQKLQGIVAPPHYSVDLRGWI